MSGYLDAPAGKYGFMEVTPDGHFKFENSNERFRQVGVVNVANANYPTKEQSKILAARLAKFGINLVRIHLIDVDWQHGLFANSADNTLELSDDRLDKMDYFIKCLKDKGIYFNFCIHAGRIYKEGDQLDAPIQNDLSKYSTLFNNRLIELQKDFAQKTISHTNPYTGLSYADDPAMVSVELTNENSLFNGWLGWQRDYIFGETPEGIGPYYSNELDTLFNAWLKTKYTSDSLLIAAWSFPSGEGSELILNPSFEDDLDQWSNYVRSEDGAEANIEIDPDTVYHGSRSARVTSTSSGTRGWHIHLKTNEFSVVEGESYRISFFAKSDVDKRVQIEIMENNTWYWSGAPQYTPGPDWKKFEFYFTCTKTTDQQIIQFEYGTQTGTFWLDAVSVTRFDGVGIEPGESMAGNNVERTRQTEIGKYSPRRIGDNVAFYFDLEGRYIDTLTQFLKSILNVKCPVTFTNNYYGLASIYSQSRTDYMDTHYYWDHPHFPNGWSETDFTLNNNSMMLDPVGSTLNRMPLSRVKGMPLVLSEYNHAYPYIFQSEAPSLLYAYGSFFDLDGIFWHAYYDYHDRFQQREQDMFFDIAMHPVMMTQMLLAIPYRLGTIQPPNERVIAHYSEQELFDNTKFYQDNEILNMPPGEFGSSFLQKGFAHGSFDADSTYLEGELAGTERIVTSDTGELSWNGDEGFFTVNNPYWQGATGYLKGKTIELEDITLSDITTTEGLDFAAVHLISIDSLPVRESKKLILLTSARLENEGFLWNDSRTSPVSIGGTRALCEPVTGTLGLKFPLMDSTFLFRLDEVGARSDSVRIISDEQGGLISFNHNTLWYEIMKDSATYHEPDHTGTVHDNDQYIMNYPNPCHDYTVIEYSIEGNQHADLVLLNSSGHVVYFEKLQLTGQRSARTTLDLSDYANGLYLYKLQPENGPAMYNKLIIIN